jgi:hypothetical protein
MEAVLKNRHALVRAGVRQQLLHLAPAPQQRVAAAALVRAAHQQHV